MISNLYIAKVGFIEDVKLEENEFIIKKRLEKYVLLKENGSYYSERSFFDVSNRSDLYYFHDHITFDNLTKNIKYSFKTMDNKSCRSVYYYDKKLRTKRGAKALVRKLNENKKEYILEEKAPVMFRGVVLKR